MFTKGGEQGEHLGKGAFISDSEDKGELRKHMHGQFLFQYLKDKTKSTPL